MSRHRVTAKTVPVLHVEIPPHDIHKYALCSQNFYPPPHHLAISFFTQTEHETQEQLRQKIQIMLQGVNVHQVAWLNEDTDAMRIELAKLQTLVQRLQTRINQDRKDAKTTYKQNKSAAALIQTPAASNPPAVSQAQLANAHARHALTHEGEYFPQNAETVSANTVSTVPLRRANSIQLIPAVNGAKAATHAAAVPKSWAEWNKHFRGIP